MMRCKFTLPELQERLECLAEEAVLRMSPRTASVFSGPMRPLLAASERRQESGLRCQLFRRSGPAQTDSPFREK